MSRKLYHACAVQIGGFGILISGQSGSGKTSTMLRLMEHAKLQGAEAHMITDDQVYLEQHGEALIASPPGQVAGLLEIRGFGICKHDYLDKSEIHLSTELVDDNCLERMPEKASIDIEGITLPLLNLPTRHEALATRIVFAWLHTNR